MTHQIKSQVCWLAVWVTALAMMTAGSVYAVPEDEGLWEGQFCLPDVGTHMVHLHTGKVLLWPGHYGTSDNIEAWLWNIEPQCIIDNPNPGFDPACIKQVNNDETNLFCSGHAPLDDGKIVVSGGHLDNNIGLPDANVFDPDTELWTGQDDSVGAMAYRRWYPTSTTLPSGHILTLSGSNSRCNGGDDVGENCISHSDCAMDHGTCTNNVCDGGTDDGMPCGVNDDCLNEAARCVEVFVNDVPETYDPATQNWTPMNGANASLPMPFYPLMFVLPDGNVFYAGAEVQVGVNAVPATDNYVLDLANEDWVFIASSGVTGGSGVMYEPGKILKSGGRVMATASDVTQIIDLNGLDLGDPLSFPSWETVQVMSAPRVVHNLTLLPDGKILATGGTRIFNREYNRFCVGGTVGPETECSPANVPPGDASFVCVINEAPEGDERCGVGGTCTGGDGTQQWVSQAEIYDPATEMWEQMASMITPRMYHSNAMLLPDGRVVVAGGGQGSGALHNYQNYELFSPPYLFKGAKPTVTDAPPWFGPGEAFFVETPQSLDISKAALIRLAAATHGFDQNQRYVPLKFDVESDGLQIIGAIVNGQEVPFNHNVVPPGYYQLFVLNQDGVPSVGRYIRMLGDTPIALCMDVDTSTDPGLCTADVSINDGSFDPDGEQIALVQAPASPYGLGTTNVELTVTDPGGLSDMCTADVMVTDNEDPVAQCNSPATITPPDAPISFTATATDNCGVASVTSIEPFCFKELNNGRIIDKTESCIVSVSGDTMTIDDSGGVNTHITWKVSVLDVNGNSSQADCEVVVVRQGGH